MYVTFDGHRFDDDSPFVFASEDGGETWRSIVSNLPHSAGSIRTLTEDRENQNVLYAGTEFAIWISLDRGGSWTKLNGNLPTVAVHAIAQHPSSGDIVAGTHGRSLWVLDVTPLRQMTASVLSARAYLYAPSPAIIWRSEPSRGTTNRAFVGENPPFGATIFYALGEPAREIELSIRDRQGALVRTLDPKSEAGLHSISWDLRQNPRSARPGAGSEMRGGSGRGGGRGAARVEPGIYTVMLTVDGQSMTRDVEIEIDPDHARGPWLDAQLLEEEEGEEN